MPKQIIINPILKKITAKYDGTLEMVLTVDDKSLEETNGMLHQLVGEKLPIALQFYQYETENDKYEVRTCVK
ncbi:hypothetical protein CUN31_03400 [Enterococcus faecalis]|uniref:hypothetical protein n=1 Tax=Enterococcus faecalis TaxID=1351 RepID=UPI0001B2E77B|nr:hypothetical protein [Enterococcus faecalis]EEU79976.1 predicted protein [Enterococcus faecalis Fly1]PQB33931.1 hypothetical protein CUN31_03400 [Enterococcus faecalis]PQB45733.1 hypothetical protein CUM81_08030 [Enterococcus faecalis]